MWKCKLCTFSSAIKVYLLRHYRLHHGQYSTVSPLPCLHHNCMCTFSSFNALKIHMSRVHRPNVVDRRVAGNDSHGMVNMSAFHCPLCDFKQPFDERAMFFHLRGHLKLRQTVPCPFRDCTFKSNVYSTYNSHKCREHHNASDYDVSVT